MNLIDRFKKIISQRQIIKSMTVKNLKEKYIGSALGILWAIINPLLIMLVIAFVFTKIMKTEIRNTPFFMLSALLPWFFFANSISEATTSMRNNIGVLSQFVMMRETVPLSIAFANFINFLFGFMVILPFFIIVNMAIAKYLLLLPALMALHFIFTLGVCLSFSIINVYFRDLSQLLNIGLMFLFWVTPVFYSLDMMPEAYRNIIIIVNPMACYAVLYRSLLYYGNSGEVYIWLLALIFALISIISGYTLFAKKETEILKYL
ncbi:MAG: ABC transporter permease [Candidatus Omnitrophica bacterium]|nr:ABC transporter permease [Candidatus Omnitrophota bacterium]MBU4148824.1 ABC transporter permease [Candidatus Omnitrophota bacterium]